MEEDLLNYEQFGNLISAHKSAIQGNVVEKDEIGCCDRLPFLLLGGQMITRKVVRFALLIFVTAGCTPVSKEAAEAADQHWIELHGDDPEAMNRKFGSEADIACAFDVDDYLRSIARYDFAWDDDAKGFSDKFTKYSLRSPGWGMMTRVSDKAKLSGRP